MATVLAVPDLHCPHHHPQALAFLQRLLLEHKPDEVVLLGDEVDFAAFSRFPKDPDALGPGDELAASCEAILPFFRLFPRAKVCTSNHTERIYRQAAAAGVPRRAMLSPRRLLGAPAGWRWRDEWKIDGVRYRHGDGLGGENAAKLARQRFGINLVFGHLHGLCQFDRGTSDAGTTWAFAVGCLIDPKAHAFSYAKHAHRKPVLGAAVIRDGNPTWFPLEG